MAATHANSLMVRTSKQLSYLLRHGAVKEGLQLRDDGYVRLRDILNRPYFRTNRIDENYIRRLVESNDKRRFELTEMRDEEAQTGEGEAEAEHAPSLFIRASQGHSLAVVDDEKLLRKLEPESVSQYPHVVHGTFLRFWEAIKRQGLRSMTRNHVHFAPGYPDEAQVISGMRASCDVLIEIDVDRAMAAGMTFYVSDNNVILTRGFDGHVAPTYFKRVVDRHGNDLPF